MAVLNDLIVQGSSRLIGEAHGTKFIVDNGTSTQSLMADGSLMSVSSATQVNSALNDLESIVGSGYTNTTITEVIENMDNAIAAALTDLDDKIGDIESILATI